MKYILEYNIDKNILTDKYEYFFTLLNDRFEYAVELWIKALEKKFKKEFKPIWVLSAKQNDLFKKENYIIISKNLKEIKEKLNKNDVIYLEVYDDLNKGFSESEFVHSLISNLIKKQGRIFILPFTSSNLYFENPNIIILGADPKIAAQFDDKTKHTNLLDKLDIPGNQIKMYNSISEMKSSEKYPFFISAAYTTGGTENAIIYFEKDLDIFYSKLREINKSKPLLVAILITDIMLSPNVTAVICGEDDTRIICITDQILRENEYLGNIYPSKADDAAKESIINTTKKIGNYLSKFGFKGLFGLDFIIDSNGKLYCIDLNPRRQGGYVCNILMSKKINIPEIELNLALNEQVPKFDYEDFQVNYAWAHSKIKPHMSNMKIMKCFKKGNPFDPFENIGSEYKTIFYPADYLIINGTAGYIIISGSSYEEVKEKIIKKTEILISETFKL